MNYHFSKKIDSRKEKYKIQQSMRNGVKFRILTQRNIIS